MFCALLDSVKKIKTKAVIILKLWLDRGLKPLTILEWSVALPIKQSNQFSLNSIELKKNWLD